MSKLTLTGEAHAMAEVIKRLARTKPAKTTLPVLGCVRILVSGGRATATTTNLDQWHEAPLPGEAQGEGGFCVAAPMFAGLLARCNGDGVTLTHAGRLTVSAGGRTATVATLPDAEFPLPPLGKDWTPISRAGLADTLRVVAPFQSEDETRYVLNGVYFDTEGLAVATDGRTMALCRAFEPGAVPPILDGVILPSTSVPALCDLLDRAAEGVELGATESGLAFRCGDETYATRRIEGDYPAFRQVIPTHTYGVRIQTPRAALAGAVDWVRSVGSPDVARLTIEGSTMTLSCSTPDTGDLVETIELGTPVAAKVLTAFAPKYLVRMLAARDGDQVELQFDPEKDGSQCSPLQILDVPGDRDRFLGIIMPMRVPA